MSALTMGVPDVEENIKLFQMLGLSEQKAKETIKNVQVTGNLVKCIEEVINNFG